MIIGGSHARTVPINPLLAAEAVLAAHGLGLIGDAMRTDVVGHGFLRLWTKKMPDHARWAGATGKRGLLVKLD